MAVDLVPHWADRRRANAHSGRAIGQQLRDPVGAIARFGDVVDTQLGRRTGDHRHDREHLAATAGLPAPAATGHRSDRAPGDLVRPGSGR